MFDVVALGEVLIDFTPKGADEGGNLIMQANPGGAPGNFLAALASCGMKTAFIGKVGDDAFGHLLIRTLSNVGIDTSAMAIDPNVFTTLAFVTLDAGGDREFSFARKPGADTMLRPEEVDHSLLQNTRVFHFGTLSLTDEPARSATAAAIQIAREAGAMISFDPNYRKPLWKSEKDAVEQMVWGLRQADIVKISQEEMEMIFDEDLETAGKKLLTDFNVQLAFLTCGKTGGYYCNRNAYAFSPSFIELKTIDTTGAGDVFGGSAMAKVLEFGKSPDSLSAKELDYISEFANAMAGLSTTKLGGIPSVPKPEEASAIMKNDY